MNKLIRACKSSYTKCWSGRRSPGMPDLFYCPCNMRGCVHWYQSYQEYI